MKHKKKKIVKKEKKETKAVQTNKDILLETIIEIVPETMRSFDIREIVELAGLKKLSHKEIDGILAELKKDGILIHKAGIQWVRAE
jgi:Glu-tRNA(Gln) amidotransferase subunit E-like FAD-binding protein